MPGSPGCQRGRLRRDHSPVRRVLLRPTDNLVIVAPDNAPYVEQHDPAESAANSNGQQPVALPAVAVEAEEQVSADDRQYANQNGQDRAFVHLNDENHRVDNREGSSPDQEEAAESHAGGSLPVAGVCAPETPSTHVTMLHGAW